MTKAAQEKCMFASRLIIPPGDINRDRLFGDPLFGVVKDITIERGDRLRIYSDKDSIDIDVSQEDDRENSLEKLVQIHRSLQFTGGHIHDELPEQVLSVRYIRPSATILELGSNIGRNTLVLSRLVNDDTRIVTLETDPLTCQTLLKNKEMNHMGFHIVNAALSYRKLVQRNWETIPCDSVPQGYFPVTTVTFEEIQETYNLRFDTLVADCEGALYFILQDRPQILDNIETIILENDYKVLSHKEFVCNVLKEKGLTRVYCKEGGWAPCYREFYEVWERLTTIPF